MGALKLVKETGERFVAFYPQALDELCRAGGFSKSSFLSWAKKKKAVLLQSGKFTRPTRINGALVRCAWVKVEDVSEFGTDKNGFIQVDESMQEELPFD